LDTFAESNNFAVLDDWYNISTEKFVKFSPKNCSYSAKTIISKHGGLAKALQV